MERNYYEILGIEKCASEKEIKAAYRNIIKLCHPDSPNCRMTREDLHQVQEAYEVLSNKLKKTQYDRTISADKERDTERNDILVRHERPDVRSYPNTLSNFTEILERFSQPFSSLFDFLFDRSISQNNMAPQRRLEIILTTNEAQKGGVFEIGVPDIHGVKIRSFSIRIPPRVRSGTRLVVDLEEVIGTYGDLEITILKDSKR
jgi:DnaJ-class molecular chaperone